MSYSLRYRSSRRDVWKWYWDRWLNGFWLRQLLIALGIASFVTRANHLSFAWFLATLSLAFVFLVVVFAAWPQLAFKSQERVLEVGPAGWSTKIGTKTGSKSWREVDSVTSERGTVVIASRSGNALIIPSSVFSDSDEQQRFIRDAQTWKAEHAV